MQPKRTRSKYAQNRIAYIVFGNPNGVRQMLFNAGYHPPKDIHDLLSAAKEWVQLNGKKAISNLLQVHPEKELLQNLASEDRYCGSCGSSAYNSELNYCGACGNSNFSGGDETNDSFIQKLLQMSTEELENYYTKIISASNKNPKDISLAEEVQLVWNELRKRTASENGITSEITKEEKTAKEKSFTISKDKLMFLGVTLVAGILIGSSLKR